MNRRSFLGSILAAAVAPAIVRADSLMRIVPRETVLITWGDYLTAREVSRFSAPLINMPDVFQTLSGGGNAPSVIEYFADEMQLAVGQLDCIRRVWADGREIDARLFTLNQGRAVVHYLSLTEFGNRFPHLEFEGVTSDVTFTHPS